MTQAIDFHSADKQSQCSTGFIDHFGRGCAEFRDEIIGPEFIRGEKIEIRRDSVTESQSE
ncbi:MAG: hypothetical protein MUF86_01075 [Akkermansiaceae bacterium]|nr:hypothetical protein [Akkermansiaceae bacterium]